MATTSAKPNSGKEKSLWEKLWEELNNFVTPTLKQNNQNQEEEEIRKKKEKWHIFSNRFRDASLEFDDLSKISSYGYKMPGYMMHSHHGPDSEIRALAEHFRENDYADSLNTILDNNNNLQVKELAYNKLKAGIESFKREKQENVPEADKSNANFGLDKHTADQIRKMSQYLDDYIAGERSGTKDTSAEAKLNQTKETINNPYYSPEFKSQSSTSRSYSQNDFYQQSPPKPNPYQQHSTNNTDILKAAQFIKENDLTEQLSTFLADNKTSQEKNKAFRQLALSTHPDKVSSQAPEIKDIANKIFTQVNNFKNSPQTDKNHTGANDFLNTVHKTVHDQTSASNQFRPSPRPK